MAKDSYGNYINNEGITIKVQNDSKNTTSHFIFSKDNLSKREDAKKTNIHTYTDKVFLYDDNENKMEKKSLFDNCYLTLACIKHYLTEFSYNCYELTMLKWFIDNFVLEEDIEHYYSIAPVIVNSVNEFPNSDLVYKYIYEDVVDYCVKAIENGDYINAYDRYRDSISNLEEIIKEPLQNSLIKAIKKITLSDL